MRVLSIGALAVVALLAAGPQASAEVRLTIQNGRVSLVAKDATVRQILAEWARVGQTRIVNGDRIAGGPVTLELDNVPEEEALDVVLRNVSGYVAAPRAVATANASRFDRILVMPTSTAPAVPAAAARPAQRAPSMIFPQPGQPFPVPQVAPTPDDDTDEEQPPVVLPQPSQVPQVPQQVPRPPFFTPFPPPRGAVPQEGAQPASEGPLVLPPTGGGEQPATSAPYPGGPTGAPAGVAVPGMPVPAPQQPGQPGAPQPQPRRPGGEL